MGQITGWNRGPALDAVDDGFFEVGDQLLVLVECSKTSMDAKRLPIKNGRAQTFWDPHVITCTETGWDDANGEEWSAWDWVDVSYWIKLDKMNLPPLGEGN